MSLDSELTAAAAEAQTVLAEMNAGGTFTISGDAAAYSGVFYEINESDPLDASGIKTIRLLQILATKAQFTAAPSAAPRRTVVAKGASWVLTSTTDMPQHYRLTCRPL